MVDEQVDLLLTEAVKRDKDSEPDVDAGTRIRQEVSDHIANSWTRRCLHWGLPLVLLAVIICVCVTVVSSIRTAVASLPYPICVMLSEYADLPIRGVEDAAIVYEWIERDGSTRLLAVFTQRTDTPVGPVAPLGLGGADLAYTYGTVVCSMVETKARSYMKTQVTPLMVYEPTERYVSITESLQNLDRLRFRLLPDEDYVMKRSNTKTEGSPAPVVVGRRDDGTEVFRWKWDGQRYQRKVGDALARVSALVILQAPDVHDSPNVFPDEAFRGDGEQALLYAHCRQARAFWTRRLYPGPVILHSDQSTGIPLPRGPVWFHIRSKADYQVAAVTE